MKYKHNFNPTISDADVFDEIVKEKESIGYYNLVHQDTTDFKEYASSVKQTNIVVATKPGLLKHKEPNIWCIDSCERRVSFNFFVHHGLAWMMSMICMNMIRIQDQELRTVAVIPIGEAHAYTRD